MCNFIKLTNACTNEPFYLNMDLVILMDENDGKTYILDMSLGSEGTLEVKEPIEVILKKIVKE